MSAHPELRRVAVIFGVVASLAFAGATIRAASMWTSSQAPLSVAPASVESVQRALEQERARSQALEAQLATLQSTTGELSAALAAARDRLGTDQSTADGLRASLDAAQAKLAKLEAALKAAAARPRTISTSASGGAGSTGVAAGGGEPNDD